MSASDLLQQPFPFGSMSCSLWAPFESHELADRQVELCCRNSEIYNHEHIKEQGLLKGVSIVKDSKSDSAIIGHLYEQLGDSDDLWNSLDGIFACVVYDEATGYFCAARDPLGICPLYWGRGADGSYWFCSEMKGLQDRCTWFDIFEPVCLHKGICSRLWAAATGIAATVIPE